jgi:hypothetical protein
MAEIIFTHSYLLLILPLLGFVVIGLWMARKYPKMAGCTAWGWQQHIINMSSPGLSSTRTAL